MITEAGKPQIFRTACWLGTLRLAAAAEREGCVPAVPAAGGGGLFVLSRLSSDWVRPAHVMEGNLLYSESTELNSNLIFLKKTLSETSRMMSDHISGHRGPAELTHKTNHHRPVLFYTHS